MGHKNSKANSRKRGIIGKPYLCPTCDRVFPGTTPIKEINNHQITCAHDSVIIESEPDEILGSSHGIDNFFLDSPYLKTSPSFSSYSARLNKPFDSKVKDLKRYINSIKIPWTEGCNTISVAREYALPQSMEEIKKVNLYKELKIDFKGEVSYDAGGIIREWFMVLIKELESRDLGLFEKSDCDEYSFVPAKNLKNNAHNLEYFAFIGKLIAKALIDNITINLCFNKVIYKMIVGEKVQFEDLKFIDKQLFLSLSELKKIDPQCLTDLCLYYVVEYTDENGELVSDELIPGGKDILVNNIDDYIDKRINYMIRKNKIFIDELKNALFSIISREHFRDFNSYEFELLVNGKPLIDLAEWCQYTNYLGKYSKSSKVITWFWECLGKHTQEELRRFLQFSTGSCRVPIGGFEILESNRGEIAKFTINSVTYNSKGYNFIKAHTCFNRIDLPQYKTEKEVDDAINYVLNNEIIGFGID